MERFQKFSVYLLIVLSLITIFEIGHVPAIPAPSTNCIIEPGASCGPSVCTFVNYPSGSSYLGAKGTGGGNAYSETDPGKLVNDELADSLMASGGEICFSSGAFPNIKTQMAVSIAGVKIECAGKFASTLKLDPTFAINTAMLLVNADRFTIRDCAFDGNNVAGSLAIQTGSVAGPHNSPFNVFWNFNAEDLVVQNFKTNIGAVNIQGYYYVWVKTVEITSTFNAMFLGNLAFYHLIADYLHDNTVGLNTQAGDGEILGGTYYNNTQYGILVGANAAPFLSDLTIDGISSSINGRNGVKIGYAQITIANSWIFDNGWDTVQTNVERAGVQMLSSQNCQIVHTQVRGINKATQTYGVVEQNGAFNALNNYYAFDNFGGNSVSAFSAAGNSALVVSTLNFNPLGVRSVTAGASVWTYTNADNVYEQIQLITVNGLTSWTCRTITMSNTVQTRSPILGAAQSCAVTWATTAPVFEVFPQ